MGSIMKILSVIVFISIFLSGCSTTSPYCETPEVSASEESAKIIIYRPQAFYGALYSTPFSIDGCRVKDLSNNSYAVYYVSPGQHSVAAEVKAFASGGDGVVKGNYEAGKTYYLHYSISAGNSYYAGSGIVGFTTSTQFFMVNKSTAFDLMPTLANKT